jgi:hypothetical protein
MNISEELVPPAERSNYYHSTWFNISEDLNDQRHCERLKSCRFYLACKFAALASQSLTRLLVYSFSQVFTDASTHFFNGFFTYFYLLQSRW